MSIRKMVPIEQTEWSVEPPADWVRPRSIDWSWRPPENTALAMLLIDEQHDIATQAGYYRTVRLLNSLSAVQAQSQVAVEFDPAAQRLRIHELVVWRLDPDGSWRRREPVRADGFLLRQREQQLEQQMLNGRVSLVALLEDVRVGDVIDLAYTLEPRDPLPGFRFTSIHFLAWTVPVATASVCLIQHPDHPLRWHLHAPADAPAPDATVDGNRATWQLDAPGVFQPEVGVPGGHWPYPVLESSAWASWGEVAQFLAALWEDALNDDAESIAIEAARLAADKTAEEAILAALRFVQEEVRYLAVDFGHGGGMLPNGAGSCLRRRFGDCKDKSVLLTALLRTLGHPAQPMLVSTGWRDAVMRLQPSTGCFSHVIVAFDFAGVRHFVDPTQFGQSGDLAHRSVPPYRVGLLVAADSESLTELPEPPLSELLFTETFTLDHRGTEGSAEQQLLTTGSLADDLRAAVVRSGLTQIAKLHADTLKRHFPGLQARYENANFEDDATANQLLLRCRHGLPTWGPVDRKPPDHFGYGAHGLFLAVETIDESEQRRQPFALRHPIHVQHRVIVRGKPVRKVKPLSYRHEGPGFIYRVDVRASHREVRFDYRWESTASEISPEQWPSYCAERRAALDRAGALVPTPALKPWRIALRTLPVAAIVASFAIGWFRHSDSNRVINAAGGVERAASLAFEHVTNREFSKAYELADAVRSQYRNNFEMQLVFAEAAIRTGHFQEADDALTTARKLRAGQPLTEQLQAALFEARGELRLAKDALTRITAQDDAPDAAFSDLARLSERLGDAAGARKAWETVLARQPANADALFRLARLRWAGGEGDAADRLITGVIAAQPTPSALLEATLARYFSATGRPDRAIEPNRKAAALAPNDLALTRQYVMSLLQSGRYPESLAAAAAMAERFPNNPLSAGALATAAAMAGDDARAEPAFRSWIELAPDDPDAVSNFGFFLHRAGRDAEARELLKNGTQHFPGHGNLWLNYAVVLEALGDAAAAEARRQAARLMTDEQRATLVR